jgi:hypothetical protein
MAKTGRCELVIGEFHSIETVLARFQHGHQLVEMTQMAARRDGDEAERRLQTSYRSVECCRTCYGHSRQTGPKLQSRTHVHAIHAQHHINPYDTATSPSFRRERPPPTQRSRN